MSRWPSKVAKRETVSIRRLRKMANTLCDVKLHEASCAQVDSQVDRNMSISKIPSDFVLASGFGSL